MNHDEFRWSRPAEPVEPIRDHKPHISDREMRKRYRKHNKQVDKKIPSSFKFADALLVIVALICLFTGQIIVAVVCIGLSVLLTYIGRQEVRKRIKFEEEQR